MLTARGNALLYVGVYAVLIALHRKRINFHFLTSWGLLSHLICWLDFGLFDSAVLGEHFASMSLYLSLVCFTGSHVVFFIRPTFLVYPGRWQMTVFRFIMHLVVHVFPLLSFKVFGKMKYNPKGEFLALVATALYMYLIDYNSVYIRPVEDEKLLFENLVSPANSIATVSTDSAASETKELHSAPSSDDLCLKSHSDDDSSPLPSPTSNSLSSSPSKSSSILVRSPSGAPPPLQINQSSMLMAPKDKPYRVLIYSTTFAPHINGIATRIGLLYNKLRAHGWEALIVAPIANSTNHPAMRPVRFVHNKYYKDVGLSHPLAIIETIRLVEDFKPDIVHMLEGDPNGGLMVMYCQLLKGIPAVLSVHTDVLKILRTLGFASIVPIVAFLRLFYNIGDEVLCPSEQYREHLRSEGIYTTGVVYDIPVNLDLFKPLSPSAELRERWTFGNPDAKILLFVGRISAEKNIDFLYELLQRNKGWYLVLLGDGPYVGKWKELHGPEHRLFCEARFISHAELPLMYNSGDVFVSASEIETHGITVIESQACGLPVVVADAQGHKRSVRHGQNGFLFEPRNMESCEMYVHKVLDEPLTRQRFSIEGRRSLEEHSNNDSASLLKIYRDLIETNRSTDPRKYVMNRARILVYFTCALLIALIFLGVF